MKRLSLFIFLFILMISSISAEIFIDTDNWFPSQKRGFYVNVGGEHDIRSENVYAKKYWILGESTQDYNLYMGNGDSNIFESQYAMSFVNNDPNIMGGSVTHYLEANKNTTLEAWQVGLNNSWGFHRNSYGIFSDNGYSNNLSHLTNAILMWNDIGINAEFDYSTAKQGATLGVQYGIETQKIHIHDQLGDGEISGSGEFTWLGRDGTDFDVYNVPLHLETERIEEVTTGIGDIQIFKHIWDGQPTGQQPPIPYTETGTGTGSANQEWSTRSNVRCFSNPCIRAKGGDSGDIRSIDYNFSTLNVSAMELSFYYGSNNMDTDTDEAFEVFMNNNAGSGWVSIWRNESVDEDINPAVFKNFTVPVSMNNEPIVSIRFNHNSDSANQESFLDNIKINGTSGAPIIQNISYWDASIEFGRSDNGGFGEDQIKYNGTTSEFTITNNITIGTESQSSQFKIRDTDNAGWTCCTTLNGAISCTICS